MAAAGSGSAKVVKALLSRGAEVDVLITRSKIHAAHLAARCGALDVLQVLSAYGAHFDQLDDKNNTPIHYAALAGHGPCCRFLAQRGA
jgi:ankyrin repeat protein